MKTLSMQKRLAADVLGVGRNRVKFDTERLDDIRESLTKEDIRELIKDKAIAAKPINKKTKKEKHKKARRGIASTRKKISTRKQRYVKLIRKLRKYLKALKSRKIIENKEYRELRKLAKANRFKSKRHLKEYIREVIKKEIVEKAPEKTQKKQETKKKESKKTDGKKGDKEEKRSLK